MNSELEVLGICGSLRQGSWNRALLRAAIDLAPDGMRIRMWDELRELPWYDADLEAAGPPDVVQRFRDQIRAADALVIATPEYNYSVPGVLKNAIDWASRPVATSAMKEKPVAIFGAGGISGSIRAQHHLRQILQATNSPVVLQPQVIVQFPAGKFDEAGNLTDEKARDAMRQLLAALAAWAPRFR